MEILKEVLLPAMDQVAMRVGSLTKTVEHGNGMLASLTDPVQDDFRPQQPSSAEVKDMVKSLYRPIASLLFEELFSPGLANLIHNLVPIVIESALAAKSSNSPRSRSTSNTNINIGEEYTKIDVSEANNQASITYVMPSYASLDVNICAQDQDDDGSAPQGDESYGLSDEHIPTEENVSMSSYASLGANVHIQDQYPDADGSRSQGDESYELSDERVTTEENGSMSLNNSLGGDVHTQGQYQDVGKECVPSKASSALSAPLPVHGFPNTTSPIHSNISLRGRTKMHCDGPHSLPRSVYEERSAMKEYSNENICPLETNGHVLGLEKSHLLCDEGEGVPPDEKPPPIQNYATSFCDTQKSIVSNMERVSIRIAEKLKNWARFIRLMKHSWPDKKGSQMVIMIVGLVLITIAFSFQPRWNSATANDKHPLWSAIQQSRIIS